jgi:hypothetical protein
MRSISDLLCREVPLHTGCNEPKSAGDLVMVGSNHGPIYEIVHVEGSLAWIRPLANGQEGLVPLERLRTVT